MDTHKHPEQINHRLLRANEILIRLYQDGTRVTVQGGQLSLPLDAPILPNERANLVEFEPEIVRLLKRMNVSVYREIMPRSDDCVVPLTPYQLTMRNFYISHTASLSTRVSSFAVRFTGPLDTVALRSSIDAVVLRHDALRSRIAVVDNVPRQIISDTVNYQWELIDLTGYSAQAGEAELRRQADNVFFERIDIARDSLVAVKLFRLNNLAHVLLIELHSLISDGSSHRIFLEELMTIYTRTKQGEQRILSGPTQFSDYAVWLEQSQGAWLHTHKAYWTERLRGSSSTQLPLRDVSSIHDTTVVKFCLGLELTEKLRSFSRKQHAPTSMSALTIFSLLMSRWCNQEDLVIWLVSSGRYGCDLQRTIGHLAELLYFRIAVFKGDGFLDLLQRVCEEFRSSLMHPIFGWPIDPSPRTEVIFNWHPDHGAEALASRGFGRGSDRVSVAPYPLTLVAPAKFGVTFYDTRQGIGAEIICEKTQIDTAEKFGRDFTTAIERVTCDPARRLCSLLS